MQAETILILAVVRQLDLDSGCFRVVNVNNNETVYCRYTPNDDDSGMGDLLLEKFTSGDTVILSGIWDNTRSGNTFAVS